VSPEPFINGVSTAGSRNALFWCGSRVVLHAFCGAGVDGEGHPVMGVTWTTEARAARWPPREGETDVRHRAPRCLLGFFDAAATGLTDCSEFDAKAAHLSIEVRGLSREDLSALIENSTHEIPTFEHRTLHQEASDFV
jgi:hypothetical protein